MKLYLNEDCGIDPRAVVAILDMDSATEAPITREFLTKREKAGDVVLTTAELPISFIVTDAKENNKVLLTRNAPKVIARRTRRAPIVR